MLFCATVVPLILILLTVTPVPVFSNGEYLTVVFILSYSETSDKRTLGEEYN